MSTSFLSSPFSFLHTLLLLPHTLLTQLLSWLALRIVLPLTLLLSLAYTSGLLYDRLLPAWAEWHATHVLNGTPVTVGRLTLVDLLHGRLAARNVVIHAPCVASGESWEAPIVCRMEEVYVEWVNLWQWIWCWIWFLGEELPLELRKVELRNVQIFVERKQGRYNFLWLDPHWVAGTSTSHGATSKGEVKNGGTNSTAGTSTTANTTDTTTTTTTSTTTEEASTCTTTTTTPTNVSARQILDDLLDAVGRATRDGTPNPVLQHVQHRWRTTLPVLPAVLPQSIAATTARFQRASTAADIVRGRVEHLRVTQVHLFVPDAERPWRVPVFEWKQPADMPYDENLETVWDAIVKRFVAEVATTNVGRFWQTAMHEMAEVLREEE